METKPKVAIIILTFNQIKKTLRCICSVKQVSYDEKVILLFDNGSIDNTIETVQKEFSDIMTYYSVKNLGVASGRNAGAEIAKNLFNPKYLLFLDNDTTVEPDFLEKLVKALEEDSSIAIVTSKIKCNDDSNRIFAAGGCSIKFWLGITAAKGYRQKDDGRFDKPFDCIASGGCMLVRTEIFFSVNGFDPIFNPYGPEDLDFVFKVRAKNYRSVYIPESVIYHDSIPSRSSSAGEMTSDYILRKTKNFFIILLRHAPLAEKIIFLFLVAPLKFSWLFLKGTLTGNFKIIISTLKGFIEFAKEREKDKSFS